MSCREKLEHAHHSSLDRYIGLQSTDTQPIVRPYSAHCRSSIRRQSADCRLTIGRFTSGWLVLCNFPFFLIGRRLCFGFSTLRRKSLNLKLSILKITLLTILTIQNTIKHTCFIRARFSVECRKITTKVITMANQREGTCLEEPMRRQSKTDQTALSAGKRA